MATNIYISRGSTGTHRNEIPFHVFTVCFYSSFRRISEIEPKYYADGEDAYAMKRNLVQWAKEQGIDPADKESFFKVKASAAGGEDSLGVKKK